MRNDISVVLADDHLMFREGVKALLESEGLTVMGEAPNGNEAIRLVRKLNPQVAILDFSMPLLNGIDAATAIQKQSPQTKLVMLTMYSDDTYALAALKCGIRGIVLKNQASTDLVTAIRDVVRGSVYLSPSISDSVVSALLLKHVPENDSLTVREKQDLQLIAEGNTSKEIARLLHLSVKTIESHRSRIMTRLGIHNTADLVRYAIRNGVIQA